MGEECKCKAVVFSFEVYYEFSDNEFSYMLATHLHACHITIVSLFNIQNCFMYILITSEVHTFSMYSVDD